MQDKDFLMLESLYLGILKEDQQMEFGVKPRIGHEFVRLVTTSHSPEDFESIPENYWNLDNYDPSERDSIIQALIGKKDSFLQFVHKHPENGNLQKFVKLLGNSNPVG